MCKNIFYNLIFNNLRICFCGNPFEILTDADNISLFQKVLMRTGTAGSDQPLKLVTSSEAYKSSPHLFQTETLSRAVNYKHNSRTVPWGLQTDMFISFHAHSTMRHHGGISADLQILSISSTVQGPLCSKPIEALVLRADGPWGGGLWLCPNPTLSWD